MQRALEIFLFEDRVSLCSPVCLRTCCVDQAGNSHHHLLPNTGEGNPKSCCFWFVCKLFAKRAVWRVGVVERCFRRALVALVRGQEGSVLSPHKETHDHL